MNVVKCPYCGTEHSEGTCFDACPHCHAPHQPSWAKFCNSCGAELTPTAPLPVDTVIATKCCPQCHTSGLPESAAFCSVCGYDFNARKESPRIVINVKKCARRDVYSNAFIQYKLHETWESFLLKEGVNILRLSQYPWIKQGQLSFNGIRNNQMHITEIQFINANLDKRILFHTKCSSLSLSYIDTSEWTSFQGMFQMSDKLENLVLNGFDTRGIMEVTSCFDRCLKLKEINIDGWDLSKVRHQFNRQNMFRECKSLKKIFMRGCNDYTVDLVETALEEAGLNNVEIIR